MHLSVQQWLARVVAKYDLSKMSVVECGSMDVNGSPRAHFEGDYFGVDMAQGVGVDCVMDIERLEFPDESFPVVVCTEVLEHTDHPWLVVGELARVCAPGGFVLLSARGFDSFGCWRVHSYPFDSWRFSDRSMRMLFTDAGLEVAEFEADPGGPGWLVVARKPLRDVYARAAAS